MDRIISEETHRKLSAAQMGNKKWLGRKHSEESKKKIGDSNLEADHIKRFADIIRENNILSMEEARNCPELWDTKNGRTLCKTCHKNTPTYEKIKKPVILS